MIYKREANEISTISPHKTKPQRAGSNTKLRFKFKRVISFILALAMLITLAPVTTYAGSDYNGGGNDGGDTGVSSDQKDTTTHITAFWNKSGWLIYIVDTSGNRVGTPIYLSTVKPSKYDNKYYISGLLPRIGSKTNVSLYTKLNGVTKIHRADEDGLWGQAFTYSNKKVVTREPNIKAWMTSTSKGFKVNGKKATNAQWFLKKYFPELYNTVISNPDKYYIVLEPCFMHGWTNNTNVVANCYGWEYLRSTTKSTEYKDKWHWYSNEYLPNGYYLEQNWKGLPNKITNFKKSYSEKELLDKNKGYGMVAIRLSGVVTKTEPQIQSTRKEWTKKIHSAPSGDVDKNKAKSAGQSLSYDIVKDYRTIYTIDASIYNKYGLTAEEVYLIKHPKAKKAKNNVTNKGEYEVRSDYEIAVKDASRLLEDTVQKIRIEQEKSKKSTGYNVTKYVITNKNVDTKNNTYENTNIKDKETWVSSIKNIAKAQGGKYLHKSKDDPLGNKDSIVRTITEPEEKGGGGKTAKSFIVVVR